MADEVSILEQLSAVTRAFKIQLPERGREVSRLWSVVQQHPDDRVALEGLYRLIHNLAGAGGTFGFSRITDVARKATEPLRVALKERNAGLSEKECDVLRITINKLLALCLDPAVDKGEAHRLVRSPVSEALNLNHTLSKLVYFYADSEDAIAPLLADLKNLGARVCRFEKVEALREAIIKTPPSVVLSNQASSDLNGLLHDLPAALPKPPVVALAESGDFCARLAAVRAGMDGFFEYPVDTTAIFSLVESLRPLEESTPFRVLIVDDDQSQAEYARLVLERAGIITRVIHDPSEMLEQLSVFNPELLLLDIYMPKCSGVELAKVVRQMSRYATVSIVFLSVETERGRQLEALQAGADDFLTKPISPEELVSSVLIRAWRARILRWRMVRDSLTELFSHTVIMERLSNSVALAKRQNHPLSVAMIDVDHFKRINDRFGHGIGDRVLVGLSRLLRERLRSSDIIGRYGGEEFLVIMPDTLLAQALQVIEEIRVAFSRITFTTRDETFSAALSAGIASFPQAALASELVDHADRAMYRAKEQGRNRTITAAPQS